MAKDAPLLKALAELYEYFNDVIKDSTEAEIAIDFLTTRYSDSEHNLADLLTQYHDKFAVFISLTSGYDFQLMGPLLIHLIQLNERILTLPLNEENEEDSTLLDIILSEQDESKHIIEWLTRNKPTVMQPAIYARTKIQQLQKLAMTCLNEESFTTYRKLLAHQPIEFLRKMLAYNDNELLEKILDSSDTYLNHLLVRDISFLRMRTQGLSVLDCLCDEPNIYQTVLRSINIQYQNQLNADELNLLSRVVVPSDNDQENYTPLTPYSNSPIKAFQMLQVKTIASKPNPDFYKMFPAIQSKKSAKENASTSKHTRTITKKPLSRSPLYLSSAEVETDRTDMRQHERQDTNEIEAQFTAKRTKTNDSIAVAKPITTASHDTKKNRHPFFLPSPPQQNSNTNAKWLALLSAAAANNHKLT